MMARACEHHRQTLVPRTHMYTCTHIPIHARAFLLASRALTSRALTFSRTFLCAGSLVYGYVRISVRALAHSLVRHGGDRASARSAAAG